MNYPAASYGVSKTARNEASFGEYDQKRLNLFDKALLLTEVVLSSNGLVSQGDISH
jgi:hypothetical protein